MSVLDNKNYIAQHDPQGALSVAASESEQLSFKPVVEQGLPGLLSPTAIVVAGMGGSALAAGIARSWLDLPVPFELVRRYELPQYVGHNTLVIASSYSGNTEETLAALEDAQKRGAHIAVLASGGKLLEIAKTNGYPYIQLTPHLQPRMAVFYNLKALVVLLKALADFAEGEDLKLEESSNFVAEALQQWLPAVPTENNLAKQLAEQCAGKTPVVYAGSLMAAIAYKWKIGFNENAKNVAFTNELPEFNHNEFIGWSSHPIEKPYAVIDLISSFENPRTLKRFEISDRLLSGMRPKAIEVNLRGETVLQHMLWGAILGDFVGIYLAILNGVNPTPVDLIERLKIELAK